MCSDIVLEEIPPESAQHVAAPSYEDGAPTGGDHLPCWASYGIYDEPLEPGRFVHNLEHGAVVLLYECPEGCADEQAQLEEFGRTHERTIVSPQTNLPARFAVVAWGHRLLASCVDLDAIEAFYDAHFRMGREDVASGAPEGC